jgi:xanthine/uracil permease
MHRLIPSKGLSVGRKNLGETMQFKYGLDDKPPLIENGLLGLQWLLIAIPSILIIGKIVGGLHFTAPQDQVLYLQKMSFVMAVTLLVQVLWGHQLPLIAGPSTVLLIGVIASQGFPSQSVYTSMMIGGLLLALCSLTGLFGHLQKLFTPRVVAVVLLLIGFTLIPPVMNLIIGPAGGSSSLPRFLFALVLTFAMIYFQTRLKGIWKSTLIVWALLLGSSTYFLLFPQDLALKNISDLKGFSLFFRHLTTGLGLEPGVLLSFLFCYLALSINDLASIESLEEILHPPHMTGRINRGITFTGMANILAGFFGVIGPVNFSLSPGVILSTRCASRYTLLPAAVLLLFVSISPAITGLMSLVPSVVIGCLLLYLLCFQVGAGLVLVSRAEGGFQVETGVTIGLPLLLGTLVAFFPAELIASFPVTLRPILGNGFVVGIFTAFLLDGLVFKSRSQAH